MQTEFGLHSSTNENLTPKSACELVPSLSRDACTSVTTSITSLHDNSWIGSLTCDLDINNRHWFISA